MTRVFMRTIGPSVDQIVRILQQDQGWLIEAHEQTNTQRGYIIGSHEEPFAFLGFGVSDGSRIMDVVPSTQVADVEDSD